MTSNLLKVYPAGSGKAGFIGQIEINDTEPSSDSGVLGSTGILGSLKGWSASFLGGSGSGSGGVDTIILLDVSGSMGQNVQRVVKNYLPNALEKAGYSDTDVINLVTFSSQSRAYDQTITQLRTSRQSTEGATFMAPGIKNIGEILRATDCNKVRIMAISDGELHDQHDSVRAANQLVSDLSNRNMVINSTAIRFKTGGGSPDTRGLSSLLQLGNTHGAKFIVEVDAYGTKVDQIINTMAELLQDDLGSSVRLVLENSILLKSPWDTSARQEIHLVEGTNTFWLSELPSDGQVRVVLESSDGAREVRSVSVEQGEVLNFESYNTVLKTKVDHFMKRLRILKVVGTPEASAEIASIVSYFDQLEKYFSINEACASDRLDNTLQSRLAFFKEMAKKKARSVALTMSELANDDRVSAMNSAQQADFLRSAVSSNSNARSLAKRATKQGLDFDTVAIREVREMYAHLSELDDISDESHYVSFYSQETTLGGIRTVCELATDGNVLNEMSAFEILQLLNIVGLPCRGPVGDFPDPKTYHLDELLLGSTVSMSDVMMVKNTGGVLRDPYSDKEIQNVIPFYDDDRIQQFLMRYAPTLLEYTASVGMRNMILEVPHTYKYTVVGGLWNMARRLDSEKTDANVDVLTKLILTYKTAVDGIFDYVVPMIKEQSTEDREANLSFYIANNGTTNMISPLITIMEELVNGSDARSRFVPEILRALYSFEFYQVIRKFHRSADDKIAQKKAMLDSLLGIDFSQYGTPLPEYFEKISNPQHHREYHINSDSLRPLIERVPWVDKITLLPFLILNSFKGAEGRREIMEMSEITNETIESVLKLDGLSLEKFKFYCIVQSFMFDTKDARVDDENRKMKIEDCVNSQRMDAMIQAYVEKQYRADYQARLAVKERKEREALADELVVMMMSSTSVDEFVQLFRTGLARNHVSVVIYDTHQLGFAKLRDSLFDPNNDVPLRRQKLWTLVMAVEPPSSSAEFISSYDLESERIVWNKGNPLRMSVLKLEEWFGNLGLGDFWSRIYPLYKAKNIYVYRESDKPNRHTHCNSKISFWAMGYPTVGKYFSEISKEEQEEYMRIHTHCCGIWDGKLVKPA